MMTLDTLEKYFCLLLLAAVPVLYFPVTHNPVLIKSLVLALTVLIWVILKAGQKDFFSKIHFYWIDGFLWLWIFLNFISLGMSHSAYVNYLYLGEMLVMAGVYYLFQSASSNLLLIFLLRIINAAGFWVMLWGVIQFFEGRYKPVSAFGNPNYFGAFLVSIWPLILLQLREGGRWDRLAALINTALFGFMIYYIRSLGMMLSVVLSVYLLIWLYCKDIRKRAIFLLAAAVLSICILQIPSVHDRFLHQVSADIRPLIWKGVFNLVQAHPWLGCGAGRFQIFYPEYRPPEYFTHPLSVDNTDHAHCEPLEMAAETGIVGFLIFAIFLCMVFIKVLRNFKHLNLSQQYFAGSLLIATSLLLFENLFDVNLRYTSSKFVLWSFLGLATGLRGGMKNTQDSIYSPSYARLWSTAGVLIPVFYFCFIRIFCGDIFFKQGIRARNNNDYDTAIQCYRRAVKIDPYHIEARYRLAFLYGSSGYIERGIQEYSGVIRIAPYFASIHNNLAILYSKANDLKLSEHHYRVQMQLNPYNPETLCGLASILLRQNRIDEAVQLLRKVLIFKPDHSFANQVLKELKASSSAR